MTERRAGAFRTIGATTSWNAEEAEQMLAFLDDLRADILVRYGDDIANHHNARACRDSLAELLQTLELDEPAIRQRPNRWYAQLITYANSGE